MKAKDVQVILNKIIAYVICHSFLSTLNTIYLDFFQKMEQIMKPSITWSWIYQLKKNGGRVGD